MAEAKAKEQPVDASAINAKKAEIYDMFLELGSLQQSTAAVQQKIQQLEQELAAMVSGR